MKKILFLLAFSFCSWGGENLCPKDADYTCMNTLLGKLNVNSGTSEGKKESNITLNNKVIFTVDSDSMIPSNGGDGSDDAVEVKGQFLTRKTIIGYWEDLPCHCEKFFMLDLSGKKPIISNEFFDSESYYIDWVSWGDENSIISLGGRKYKYESGKVILLGNNR